MAWWGRWDRAAASIYTRLRALAFPAKLTPFHSNDRLPRHGGNPKVKTGADSPTVLGLPRIGKTDDPAIASEALVWATKLAVPVLLALALALRLTYYLLNPSLSVDEASLALNLMHRSYSGLFNRLDFNQEAPPAFLLLQKLAVDAFGPSPYGLRLLPFLAGAAACLLVYPLAKHTAGRPAAIVALALFAVSDPLLSYASTNKQYSVDVLVALALYTVAVAVRNRFRNRDIVLFALMGAVAASLSHPAAFVLAGIWAVLVSENVIVRRWLNAAKLIAVGTAWLGCFAAAYLLTRSSVEQIQHSTGKSSLKPNLAAFQTAGGIIRYILGIPNFAPGIRAGITLAAVVLCIVGIASLIQTQPGLAALLLAPAPFVLVAVGLGLYPNFPRMFLFALPTLLLLIASGTRLVLSRQRPRIVGAAASLALVAIFGITALQTLRHLRPSVVTEPTRALADLVEHARSGDSLYVARVAQYDYRYYLECRCFADSGAVTKARARWPLHPTAGYGQFDAALESAPPDFVAGSSVALSERDFEADFAPLVGRRRVWILFVNPDPDPTVIRPITTFLRNNGRLLAFFPRNNDKSVALLFLYSGMHHA
jgi:hypothetical protein